MQEGRASATARSVAAVRLTTPREPSASGDPDADDRLTRHVAAGAGEGGGPMNRHLAARTRFFDRVVVRALDAGVRQVVIAAAGYDGRALRYARRGVRWFELDHPDTQRDKLAAIEECGIATPSVRFVAADFTRDDVRHALTAAGVLAEPTLVLAEGIAVYLEPAVLERLLADLRAVVGLQSRLAISLSSDTDDPERLERRRAFEARVAALGEPVRSSLTPTTAAPLLERAGWRVDAPSGPLRRAGAAGLVIASAIDRISAGR